MDLRAISYIFHLTSSQWDIFLIMKSIKLVKLQIDRMLSASFACAKGGDAGSCLSGVGKDVSFPLAQKSACDKSPVWHHHPLRARVICTSDSQNFQYVQAWTLYWCNIFPLSHSRVPRQQQHPPPDGMLSGACHHSIWEHRDWKSHHRRCGCATGTGRYICSLHWLNNFCVAGQANLICRHSFYLVRQTRGNVLATLKLIQTGFIESSNCDLI